MLRERVNFTTAIALLGGGEESDPGRAAELERERARRREEAEKEGNVFRERERETIYEIWRRSVECRIPYPGFI